MTAINNFKLYFEEHKETSEHRLEDEQYPSLVLEQQQILPEEIEVEQRRAQFEAMQNLQQDIDELHDLFSEFSQQVHVCHCYF